MFENLVSDILIYLKPNDWMKILCSFLVFFIFNFLLLKWLSKEKEKSIKRIEENHFINESNLTPPIDNNSNIRFLNRKRRIQELTEKQRTNAKLARQARREAYESKKRVNEVKQELYEKKINEKVLERLLEKKRIEDQERKEYQKWKGRIRIEETGKELDFEDEVLDKEYINLSNFIDAIISRKINNVNDLSIEFHLSIEDVISRIRELEYQKLIDGVLTDKGEYIYITDDEWNSIHNYISEKGIISKSEDLTFICNQVIKMQA